MLVRRGHHERNHDTGRLERNRLEMERADKIGYAEIPLRVFKKAVQRGRSKRGGEAYVSRYVEPLSNARTKLAGFFNTLPKNPYRC